MQLLMLDTAQTPWRDRMHTIKYVWAWEKNKSFLAANVFHHEPIGAVIYYPVNTWEYYISATR